MRSELVYRAIPNPDPVFFAEMLQMPDPKPEDEERILSVLLKLQDLFLKKRDAYKKREAYTFQTVLDEEIIFLQDFDEMSLCY